MTRSHAAAATLPISRPAIVQLAHQVERGREELVRQHECPTCGVVPGRACFNQDSDMERYESRFGFSHATRYNLAVEAGTVPALPGTTVGAR